MLKKRNKKRKNKRSLRKQINKRMMLNAFLSIIVTLGIVLYFIFGGIEYIATEWAWSIADEIGTEMETLYTDDSEPVDDEREGKPGEEPRQEIGPGEKPPKELLFVKRLTSKYNFDVGERFGIFLGWEEEILEDEAISIEDEFYFNDFLIIEVHLRDQLLFTNVDGISLLESFDDTAEGNRRLFLTNKFLVDRSVLDANGETIGSIYVTINPYMVILLSMYLLAVVALSIGTAILISSVVSFYAAKMLTAPLGILSEKFDALAEDDIEQVQPLQYQAKKPLLEIGSLIDSTNKIVVKMSSYAELLNDQKTELAVQNDELVDNGLRLERLNDALKNTNVHLKDILDNVGQGFMKLKADLTVYPGYSRECDVIFGQIIHDARFASLLYPEDTEQAEFLEELLQSILKESLDRIDLYLPLLPDEIKVHEKVIQVEYNISEQNEERSIIVVLTDITEKRFLESQMEKERHVLQMIVNFLLHHSLFTELLQDFEEFLLEGKTQNWSFIEDENDNRQYVLRQLHTFKGNFGQYDAVDMADAIHFVESQVIESMDENRMLLDVKLLQNAFDTLRELIESYVGEALIKNDEFIVLDKQRIKAVIHQLTMHMSKLDADKLLPKVNALLHVSINELLAPYNMYIQKMANRLDKSVDTLKIHGEEIYVDEKRFQGFIKSLMHLFKNAVVHGIESPDERLDNDKDIMGHIDCKVSRDGNSFRLEIKDDGAGINEVHIDKIFEDQFSTVEHITLHAGRGVGLSAVKQEVEALEGEIEVRSELSTGTEFIITIPLSLEKYKTALPIKLMEEIIASGMKYFSNKTDDILLNDSYMVETTPDLELYTTTTLTKITGIMDIVLLITIDQRFEKALIQKMIEDNILDEEGSASHQEILQEVSNTILGNALGSCDDYDETLELGIPVSLKHEALALTLEKNELLSINFGDNTKSCKMYMLDMEQFKL